METPRTLAGRMTEDVMSIFWRPSGKPLGVELTTEQYNRVYSHVIESLERGLEYPKKDS
jgi:hypothetical protein